MQLSGHFSLEEFTKSEIAARHGIKNQPDDATIARLRTLAARLEMVRAVLGGVPIHITSGYRNHKLNALVGSGDTSAHLKGLAADFIAPKFGTPYEVCRAIMDSGVEFDQLIHEFGEWAHLGLSDGEPRRQVLTICSRVRGYQQGRIACS